MAKAKCDTCKMRIHNKYVILETKYWQIALSDDGRYPGRCYVTLLEHKGSLSQLSKQEWNEFQKLVYRLEAAAIEGLGATMCNWTCLLNNAYQGDPAYPHVHWHFRPRYKSPIILLGKKYEDKEFGRHYRSSWDVTSSPKLSDKEQQELVIRYKKVINRHND